MHYECPHFENVRIDQQHTSAYLYRDGTCIDVHVSKTGYRPQDKRYFNAAIDVIRFV